MKLLLAIASTITVTCSTLAAEPVRPLQSITGLDVPRYVGRWYEIAKFPNRFQKQCVSDTVAEYKSLPEGRLQVINRCRLASGEIEEAVGLARPGGDGSPAKLKVRFAPAWLAFLPVVWGDYWVIDLDEDYQMAAISEPQRQYLWILSRSPEVETARYAALLQRLSAMGLDTSRLQTTQHTRR